VELVERATGADCGEGGGERPAVGMGVVDVVGGDDIDTCARRQRDEGVVARRVERVAVVPDLDGDMVATEGPDERIELAFRDRGSATPVLLGPRGAPPPPPRRAWGPLPHAGAVVCGLVSPRVSSAPNTVGTPRILAASAKRTTPYMPSWSVRARASSPSRAASSTSSSVWDAPSRKLKLEWQWSSA